MEAISESGLGSPMIRGQSNEHSVASIITDQRNDELLVVNFDAGREVVFDRVSGGRKEWRKLSFRHHPMPFEGSFAKRLLGRSSGRSYTYVSFAEKKERAAAPMPGHMVPQLLPKQYDCPRYREKKASAGLVGSLPLLIALAAFSAPRENLKDVLTTYVRPGKWVPHGYPSGRDDPYRGMTITVYYDPSNPDGSNKESLDRIQEGVDGPFYGPEPPEKRSLAESPGAEVLPVKGLRIGDGYKSDFASG